MPADFAPPIRLLHWNACPEGRRNVHRALDGRGFEIRDVQSLEQLESAIETSAFDLILADCQPGGNQASLAVAAGRATSRPVILLFEPRDEAAAIEAMSAGASDYVLKTPLALCRLPTAISLSLKAAGNVAANPGLSQQFQLLATVHAAVYTTDASHRILSWNAAAEELYGWAAEEVLGRDVREVIYCGCGDQRSCSDCFQQLIGAHFCSEREHCTRDGRRIAVQVTRMAVRDEAGQVQNYLTTVHDVTGLNLARQAAWETEARLQLACRAAIEAIADIDLRTGQVWRSEGFHRLFGYRPEQISPTIQWWLERIHPEDLDRVWNGSLMRSGDTEMSVEYRFLRADGTYADVLHRGFVLRNPLGVALRIIFTLIDITERKRAERSLRESEKLYRLLADNSTDLIVQIDEEGRIRYVSPAINTLLGYAPDEVVGRDCYDFVHPSELPQLKELMEAGTRRPLLLRGRVRKKDGEYVWLESAIRTLVDPSAPDSQEILCVCRDCTEQMRAAGVIRVQQAELAHFSRLTSIGEMASGIAHELNQPLAAIAHYADACLETIRCRGASAEELLTWTRQIADQAQRAGDMIRRIRGFVQKSPTEPRDVDTHHLLREVLELIEPDSRLHDIQVRLDEQAPLPMIRVDKVQIQQVLVNLLRNAFEAVDDCHAENRTVIVQATCPEPHEVLIAVSDGGDGISEDQLARIFEPFFSTKPDGTGLGLTISRSLVEAHGGRLWGVVNADQGMTFSFTVPVAGPGAHDEPQADRVRGRRRLSASRSAAVDAGNDGD